jgi:hypothetical protein
VAEKLEVEVVIAPDGEVRVTTRGLAGQGCLTETAALEKAVGKVSRRQKTGEFYRQASAAATSVRRR